MGQQATRLLIATATALMCCCLLVSCTYTRVTVSPNAEAHVSILPANPVGVMSAMDSVAADRDVEAADTQIEDVSRVTSEQTATATPTLNIPMTGMDPVSTTGRTPKNVKEEKKDEQ